MIQEANNFELNNDDREALRSQSGTKSWEVQKKVIEGYILKLTSNLILGTETYPGSSEDALKELRGFTKYWGRLKELIENKNE